MDSDDDDANEGRAGAALPNHDKDQVLRAREAEKPTRQRVVLVSGSVEQGFAGATHTAVGTLERFSAIAWPWLPVLAGLRIGCWEATRDGRIGIIAVSCGPSVRQRDEALVHCDQCGPKGEKHG